MGLVWVEDGVVLPFIDGFRQFHKLFIALAAFCIISFRGCMKHLKLIRHCETKLQSGEVAKADRHHRDDSPLTEHGKHQAEALAEYLEDRKIDLLLTSICQRTQETAKVINRHHKAPVFSSMALNEYFIRDDGSDVETTEPGLVRSLGFLYQFHPYYSSVAVVSHSSILRTLLMELLHTPFEELGNYFQHPGECLALRFDWEEGDKIWRIVDTFIPPENSKEK